MQFKFPFPFFSKKFIKLAIAFLMDRDIVVGTICLISSWEQLRLNLIEILFEGWQSVVWVSIIHADKEYFDLNPKLQQYIQLIYIFMYYISYLYMFYVRALMQVAIYKTCYFTYVNKKKNCAPFVNKNIMLAASKLNPNNKNFI